MTTSLTTLNGHIGDPVAVYMGTGQSPVNSGRSICHIRKAYLLGCSQTLVRMTHREETNKNILLKMCVLTFDKQELKTFPQKNKQFQTVKETKIQLVSRNFLNYLIYCAPTNRCIKVNIQDMRMTNCATTEKGHADKGPGLKAISQR